MPWRYVVLRHEGIAEPHFDLMLETSDDGLLKSWRLSHWPPNNEMKATPLADHRRLYLDYEGPVSGDRGNVYRVETGTYERQSTNCLDLTPKNVGRVSTRRIYLPEGPQKDGGLKPALH